MIAALTCLGTLTGCLSRSLAGLQISPTTGTLASGQTTQFQAQATYTESGHATTTKIITSQVTWQSSNPLVATINSTGLATAVSAGSATITATASGSFGPQSATASITVTGTGAGTPLSRVLSSLTLIPITQIVVANGETAQFIAIGTYSSGSPATQDVTNQASWRSSDIKVAQVSSSGLVTSNGNGQATITALATSSDNSVTSATATFIDSGAVGPVILPTLTIYEVGNGTGSVSGTVNGNQVVHCGAGTGCVGNFPVGTVVTLTAAADAGSQFDGWSVPCSPATALTCAITITTNQTVGAIFDPIAP